MKGMSRRNFLGLAGGAMIGGMASYSIPGVSAAKVKDAWSDTAKSNVFFTKDISVFNEPPNPPDVWPFCYIITWKLEKFKKGAVLKRKSFIMAPLIFMRSVKNVLNRSPLSDSR